MLSLSEDCQGVRLVCRYSGLVLTHQLNESVKTLSVMRQLRRLYLSNSQISPAGVESLKTALPHCDVLWQDPEIDLIESPAYQNLESSSFEAIPNWGLMDVEAHDHGIGSTHGGIAIDKSGTIYVSSKTGITCTMLTGCA